MNADYNDIAGWDHRGLVDVFGGSKSCLTFAAKTKDELDKLLMDADFNSTARLQLVEVYMPKMDAPRALAMTAEASARNNANTE